MASRAGPRASGTDGSDYSHRETVASHYQTSADLKLSVRKCLLPHLVLAAFFVFKYFAVIFGSKYFVALEVWEMIWLCSGVCAFIGFSSLSKNDVTRLAIYAIGNFFLGLLPLAYGVTQLVKKMNVDFRDMKDTPTTWKNSPMKMAIVAVCVTWQIAGLVQSVRLIKTWRSMTDRKKTR